MIKRITIRRFKRFDDITFELPGHVVLAGPNNMGKTTVLQAIAAWGLALKRWKSLNDYQRHRGAYVKAPIARQAFSAVPLRTFELLWKDRSYKRPLEIEIETEDWTIAMELIPDSTEQINVRPRRDADRGIVTAVDLPVVFVPPMTGLATQEPVYRAPKIEQLLGQARPGEVLRNLLFEAHDSEFAWPLLCDSIHRLFGYLVFPPDSTGADIIAEFATQKDGPRFDIASGGSGFQQVLMLLTFLHTRPASVLLLDEPDAHLHIILQDTIYSELKAIATRRRSQLIVATHSEVIVNSVDPADLCILFARPRVLADSKERRLLIQGLRILSNTDIMQAEDAPGILYLEGHTDLDILREWARVLGHPAYTTLTTRLFWKPTVWELRENMTGIKAKDHYDALKLVRPDLPGFILLDGDDRLEVGETAITGEGLQRLRWRRYEIESYLLHPESLARYVEKTVGGPEASKLHVQDLRKHFEEKYPPAFLKDPLGEYPFLKGTKARTELLPPALEAAGLKNIPYTRYHEIAAIMTPAEIHPEIVQKLDALQKAFRL